MKILTRALFLAVLLGCLMAVSTPNASAEPTKKTILVLSPFQIDLSTNLIAAQAMRERHNARVSKLCKARGLVELVGTQCGEGRDTRWLQLAAVCRAPPVA